MNGSPRVNKVAHPIDYTNLGYESLREAMLEQARESVPEWTDFSENDLGVLLVELFAHACDVTMYYQTRIAANLFPETADEPDALVQLLRLIGYELAPPTPATVNLKIGFDADEVSAATSALVIPARTEFLAPTADGEQLSFETERETLIHPAQLGPADASNLRYYSHLPVIQGKTAIDDPVAESDGTANQLYSLRQGPVLRDSIEVRVLEPGNVETVWEEVETVAYSRPSDRHFTVKRDARGRAAIRFGDGTNGAVPPRGTSGQPVIIRATYRVGGGVRGNLPAQTSFRVSNLDLIRSAVNPIAAAGGDDGEDLSRARRLAPRLFRTQDRAITRSDYVDLAMQVPGVGKALAVALNWNQVVLYVAPSGQVARPSELLERDLLAFFESRRPATTSLHVEGPTPADIYLRANIRAHPYFVEEAVHRAVQKAVGDYLSFDAVEFGQSIFLSRVYDVIQSLPEVASLTVTEFSRKPDKTVAEEGIIRLDAFELPRPGYRDNPSTLADPALPTARPVIAIQITGAVSG